MKAPVGLLSGRAVLRKQDGGVLPRQAPARSKRLCVQNLIAILFAEDGEGFGFFVFFGKQNESLASIEKRPRPYHKKARQTTVRVP